MQVTASAATDLLLRQTYVVSTMPQTSLVTDTYALLQDANISQGRYFRLFNAFYRTDIAAQRIGLGNATYCGVWAPGNADAYGSANATF